MGKKDGSSKRHGSHKKKNNNIKFKIATLERKCGKVSQLGTVNKRAHAKMKSAGLDPKDMPAGDAAAKKELKALSKVHEKRMLHKDLKALRKTVKEVKGFEGQKVSRRLKALRKAGGEAKKMEAAEQQLAATKGLDVNNVTLYIVRECRSSILLEGVEQLCGSDFVVPSGLALHATKRIAAHVRVKERIEELREEYTSALDRAKKKKKKKKRKRADLSCSEERETKRQKGGTFDAPFFEDVSGGDMPSDMDRSFSGASEEEEPPHVVLGPDGEPLFIGSLNDADPFATVVKKKKKPGKNRLGQRARQALAEEKYGKEAKHIKHAKERGHGGQRVGREESAAGKKHASEPVHASWAAKQEERRKAATAVANTAVRVTFSSDDD